jgi:DNA-binding MarR family transcriptional regulator
LLRLRQERRKHLMPIDATGPAWDLLLVLFGLPPAEGDLCVGDLAIRAEIPRTTTVRWLRELHRHGFVTLSSNKRDKRAVSVKLTPAGQRAMEACFASAGLKVG